MIDNKLQESLVPHPRRLPADLYGEQSEVFRYLMYDSVDREGRPGGVLIAHVNMDWLIANLREIDAGSGNLMIIGTDGGIIASEEEGLALFDDSGRDYVDRILEDPGRPGSFVSGGGNDRTVVSFSPISDTPWILVNEQDYEAVFRHLDRLRDITVLASIAAVLLSILISFSIAVRIYKPFSNLVEQVRASMRDSLGDPGDKDDTRYLSDAFSFNVSKLKELESYRESTRDVLKENLLKTMLLEWNDSSIPESCFSEFEDLFSPRDVLNIILFKIDDSGRTRTKDPEERRETRSHIMETLNLIMGEFCSFDSFLTGSDEIILIMDKFALRGAEGRRSIREKIGEAQRRIEDLSETSLSAFAIYNRENRDSLYGVYRELQELSRYKVIFGSGCVLDEESVGQNRDEEKFNYPYQIEERLLEEIRVGNEEGAAEQLDSFLFLAGNSSIDNFMMAVTRLALAFNRMVNQININRIGEISIRFNDFYTALINADTADRMRGMFLDLSRDIITQNRRVADNRHGDLVRAVREHIEQNFEDKNLGLKSLASQFSMSTVYLGALFRENGGVSVHEYINRVRMDRVAQLLRESGRSVAEIIELAGFDNTSNFYKLFKKRFGVTPKVYRTKK
jgi:AraC-like DNA-binding protein